MKKILTGILILAISAIALGTALPADWSAGDELDAADLNSWKGQRSGHLLPISPSTNNYIDATQNIGSQAYRWKDGNFSGVIRADGQPRVSLYITANQSIGAGDTDAILWTAESSDVGNMHDSVSKSVVTVPESGYYTILCNISLDDIASYYVYIYVNGASILDRFFVPDSTNLAQGGTILAHELALSANDIVQIYIFNGQLGPCNVLATSKRTRLSIKKVF